MIFGRARNFLRIIDNRVVGSGKRKVGAAPVVAAGGLIARTGRGGVEVVVIHRPRHDDWSLPKGKADPGETIEQTALREVWEETALRCRLVRPLSSKWYPAKLVHYWVMSVEQDDRFTATREVDVVRWVPVNDATELLSHQQDRDLISEYLATDNL